MDLYKPSTIKDIMEKHGFSFSKGLGQNFIVNRDICPKMAAMCGATENDGVIEIGTGIGVLTKELSAVCKKVAAVELDDRLFPILNETLAGCDNVKIIHGDAMKADFNEIIKTELSGCENIYICANLPYYITSPIIMRLLEEKLPVQAVTVMVQKEAADRLTAEVGTREAGAVTLAVRHYSAPKLLFKVGRSSFMPSPNVDSAVIRLDIKETALDRESEKLYFRLVRAAFNQRRKTLTNSLSAVGFNKDTVAAALTEIGLKVTARGEELTEKNWQDLTEKLKS